MNRRIYPKLDLSLNKSIEKKYKFKRNKLNLTTINPIPVKTSSIA